MWMCVRFEVGCILKTYFFVFLLNVSASWWNVTDNITCLDEDEANGREFAAVQVRSSVSPVDNVIKALITSRPLYAGRYIYNKSPGLSFSVVLQQRLSDPKLAERADL